MSAERLEGVYHLKGKRNGGGEAKVIQKGDLELLLKKKGKRRREMIQINESTKGRRRKPERET